MAAFDESDCCGNGCANCVLDAKPAQQQIITTAKINILHSYTNFTLLNKTHFGDLHEVVELHFTSSLHLEAKDAYTLLIPSGQHIMLRSPLNDCDGKRLLRPYSPFWIDKDKLEFKILVNFSPNGQMSKYISSLLVGDMVEFRGPIGGQYVHNTSDASQQILILISQGVAIAPMLPIINEILENEDDMTRIFQFACFSDLRHAYFRKELQEFNKFWNFTGNVYLSRQICNDAACLSNKACIYNCTNLRKKLLYKEKIFAKRLNGVEILNAIGENNWKKNSVFVVSGSRRFLEQISNDLKNLDSNISDKNIFLL